MQKLYCYVDETGQDPTSEFFIVVAVISDKEQQALRDALLNIESLAGTAELTNALRIDGVTKSEKEVRDKLKEALDVSEQFIGKELKDVEKELE